MGYLNISGRKVKELREQEKMSHADLAGHLCEKGRYATEEDIQRMEQGLNMIYDFDLMLFSEILEIDILELISPNEFYNRNDESRNKNMECYLDE